MNLPNKLTLTRVILVPFFLLFMYLDIPYNYTIALVIFAAASITDALDGSIARKNNLVTNFGKFLDPLADKVLVMAALAVFVEIPEVNMGAVPLIIIIAMGIHGFRIETCCGRKRSGCCLQECGAS